MQSKRNFIRHVGRCFVCASLVLVAAPGSSWAQASSSATEIYAQAQTLFDKGRYSEALVGFRQAYNASSSPNARLMVAHCLIALGQPIEAYNELTETLDEAKRRAATEPKYEKTRDSAEAQLKLLEGKVGKVIVTIDDRTAEVTVNGARVLPDKLGTTIAVQPGTVIITAKHVDGRTVAKDLAVAAGSTETVTLELPKAQANPTPLETNDKPTEPPRGGGVRIAGGVVLGVGVAGAAVFAIAGSMAKSNFATLESECGAVRCTDAKYADVIDEGKTYTTVANVGLGVGVAGIVAGGLMVIFGGASQPKPSPVAISISPSRTEVSYRLTF